MIAASHRPRNWNEVIGQEQPIRVLHCVLRNKRFMPAGFIFKGPFGVGKTTAAYLFARALMCQGDDPLGCGHCISCVTAAENLDAHPSFREIDAASNSGVQNVRDLMAQIDGPALIGRWVVVVDEAHNLSPEAWDVFLKPLEARHIDIVYIFITSDPRSIPLSIVSRCAKLEFAGMSIATLVGKLTATANQENIKYTNEGLREIARLSDGRPRDALTNLALVAAYGTVTREAVAKILTLDVPTVATAILETLALGDYSKAIEIADSLANKTTASKVVEAIFCAYARDVFSGSKFAARFAPMKEMTTFLLKWHSSPKLPLDIIPLFIMELNEMRLGAFPKATRITPVSTVKGAGERIDPEDMPITPAEARALIADLLRK